MSLFIIVRRRRGRQNFSFIFVVLIPELFAKRSKGSAFGLASLGINVPVYIRLHFEPPKNLKKGDHFFWASPLISLQRARVLGRQKWRKNFDDHDYSMMIKRDTFFYALKYAVKWPNFFFNLFAPKNDLTFFSIFLH